MPKETIDRLKEVPLFSGLSENQRSDILKVAGKRVFEAGTPIVRQGKETNAAFFLILDGEVEVKRDGRTLSKLDSGQFFGEMALFGDQPRSADVIPTTDTTCLVIARWNLEEVFKSSPDIPMRMLGVLSQRLHETDKQLSE
jgi:CRP/FNR family cyclic AMP-dependent transcriptional regulator